MNYRVDTSFVFKALETVMASKPMLDEMEKNGVIPVLNKSINKLAIIQHMLPYPRTTWSENYESEQLRMTKHNKVISSENQEPDKLLTLKKVQRFRYFGQNSLEEAASELREFGTCNHLEYLIFCKNMESYDDIVLKEEHRELKQLLSFLKKIIILVKKDSKMLLLYLTEITGPCLEQIFKIAYTQINTAERHAQVKKQAKINENSYRIQKKENLVRITVDESNTEAEKENNINLEIENHIILTTLELQKKFEELTAKYNEEIETLDVSLLQLKRKVDEQREHYSILKATYKARQELINLMQEVVEERDRQLKLKHDQNNAALIIQEWWRRILLKRLVRGKVLIKKVFVKKRPQEKKRKKK